MAEGEKFNKRERSEELYKENTIIKNSNKVHQSTKDLAIKQFKIHTFTYILYTDNTNQAIFIGYLLVLQLNNNKAAPS